MREKMGSPKSLKGFFWASIKHINKDDPVHQNFLSGRLPYFLKEKAEEYKVPLTQELTNKTIEAVIRGDLFASFLLFLSDTKLPICAGMALHHPTASCHFDTKTHSPLFFHAIYTTDLIISSDAEIASQQDILRYPGHSSLEERLKRGLPLAYTSDKSFLSSIPRIFLKEIVLPSSDDRSSEKLSILTWQGHTYPSLHDKKEQQNIRPHELGQKESDHTVFLLPHCFAVTTSYEKQGFNIAATFSKSFSPWLGHYTIQTEIKSDQQLGLCQKIASYEKKNISLGRTLKSILTTGIDSIHALGWLPDATTKKEILSCLQVRAPNEKEIVCELKKIGFSNQTLNGLPITYSEQVMSKDNIRPLKTHKALKNYHLILVR